MQKPKPRLTRLTAILTQLQSKRLVTAREIAEKHQVSIRTIYRDIRTLEKSGIPIFTEEGKGYSIMEGYKIPPVMFSQQEANALITAEQIIQQNKDNSLVEHYKNAVEKIKAVLKYSQKDKTELLSERLVVRSSVKNTSSNYLMMVETAITNFQLLFIEYLSLENNQSQREIEPFAIIHTNNNWILIAFCRLRNKFRMFRLDCILKIVVKNEFFPKHKMTLNEFFQKESKKWNTPDTPLTVTPSNFAIHEKQIQMEKVTIEAFNIIGIKVRTTNENMQSAKDIGALWNKFMSENLMKKIPNKLSFEIFSIYTNYESDHTKPYDTILGCKVSSLDDIPKGMIGQSFKKSEYMKFISKGDISEGKVVYETWQKIWNTELNRTFVADFEIYGEKAQNPKDAEVDIFISIE